MKCRTSLQTNAAGGAPARGKRPFNTDPSTDPTLKGVIGQPAVKSSLLRMAPRRQPRCPPSFLRLTAVLLFPAPFETDASLIHADHCNTLSRRTTSRIRSG